MNATTVACGPGVACVLPVPMALRLGNVTYIDTGHCFGGPLTVLDIARVDGVATAVAGGKPRLPWAIEPSRAA